VIWRSSSAAAEAASWRSAPSPTYARKLANETPSSPPETRRSRFAVTSDASAPARSKQPSSDWSVCRGGGGSDADVRVPDPTRPRRRTTRSHGRIS
jgi:hypothetical protein